MTDDIKLLNEPVKRLKGYKPLTVPPAGVNSWEWERLLRKEAYTEEGRRFVDETDPHYWREKRHEHRNTAKQNFWEK